MLKPMVVDIYHGDVVVNFAETAEAGIRGVIHKATQGAGFVDRAYSARRELARRQGLLWGAYHFANDENVEAQVEHFLKVAKPDDNTLLALDYEPNRDRTMSLEQAREFLELMFERTGRRPVLYSGNLIKEELGRTIDPFFAQHRLWIAQYGPRAKLPPTWTDYWLWQFTGDGIGPLPHYIDGIKGEVDLNVYVGDEQRLAAEWAAGIPVAGHAPQTVPQPVPAPGEGGEASAPPIVVSTRSARRHPPEAHAPVRRVSRREPQTSPWRRLALGAMRILAVLGFVGCVVAGAALGATAPLTGQADMPPLLSGALGALIGAALGALLFGGLLLVVEIAETTRRVLSILEQP